MPAPDAVTKIVASLRASGHRTHAIVDDRKFAQLVKGLALAPDAVETPDADLRYIEEPGRPADQFPGFVHGYVRGLEHMRVRA